MIRDIFKKTKIIFFVVVLALFFTKVEVFASNKLNDKKSEIEAQRGQAKKEIHKLKLLERIETNRLYKNQQKLEYTQHSLQKNKRRYVDAQNEVESLEKKLDKLLVEHRRHQAYTSKRLVQIFKQKRNGYIEFLLNASDINAFLDRLYFENIIIAYDKKRLQETKASAREILILKSRIEMQKRTNSKPGDCIFFVAEVPGVVEKLAGQVRDELGKRLDLIDNNKFEFCWIVDFPMFEDNDGKLEFSHNPFSMPQGGLEALENKNPLEILAYQYDMVCNGVEIASGAVRNHDIEIMLKAFSMAGYTKEEVKSKFGALYTAFQYGAPPHAGIAYGVDRLIMLLAETESIRDVIAFPLNSKAQDLMMGAPSNIKMDLLRDVHIRTIPQNK